MPWDIRQRDGRFCVVKRDDGEVEGCHDTRAEAIAQQRALYRSESSMGGVEMSEETATRPWEGPLGLEAFPTTDKRYLMAGQISHRDLPLPLRVQERDVGGHDEALQAGRIDSLEWIPIEKFDRVEEFGLEHVPEGAVVIWGEGILDGSEAAATAERYLANGAGVSLDIQHERLALLSPDTFEEIPEDEIDLQAALAGEYVTGIAGKIGAVTIVDTPAFEEATVRIADGAALVASAFTLHLLPERFDTLVAAASPVRPKRSWFEDPGLPRLTPMTYLDSGRVFGHLCDWTGCHTGFSHICVPPFRSQTDFAFFNVGQLETEEGDLVACGKLMFDMHGEGHADPKNPNWQKASEHYDKATSVGAFVRAGHDRFGIWLAGCLRAGLSEEELQHLRSHPPSGDWRPIPGKGSELVAAFSVAVPGFPIPQALVASASDGGLTIITAPLEVEPIGPRELRRRREMLRARRNALTLLSA